MARRSGQGKIRSRGSGQGVQDSQGAHSRKGTMKAVGNQFVQFRSWFSQEKVFLLVLLGLFVLALVLRTLQYYQIGFDTWPPALAGNDPYYHKRIIDDIQTNHRHLIIDPMLNYPLGGGNPRPPFYDWSVAIFGMIFGSTLGLLPDSVISSITFGKVSTNPFETTRATWYLLEFAPSIFGSLAIFPLYMIGKETFNRKVGLLAAAALVLMPSHIERSSLGFSDHDAAIVFFLILSFFFLMRANRYYEDKSWIHNWKKPGDWVLGIRTFLVESRLAIGYNLLAGIALGAIAVTWSGFPYIFAILLIYYVIQMFLTRIRNVDTMSVFFSVFIVQAMVLAISFPYYSQVSIGAWITPLYILIAVLVLGVALVPTRDLPWIVVIPSIIVMGLVSYFVLDKMFPDVAGLLFSGGGYFVKNKLYSTIAEAQAPEISRMVASLGVAVFFMALVGVVWAALIIPKKMKKDYMLIVIWSGVAVFMTLSAARFQFNATPVFALLGAWILWKIIDKFDSKIWTPFSALDIPFRTKWFWTGLLSLEAFAVFILLMVVNHYQVDNWMSDHLDIILLSSILSIHLGAFIIMRYMFKNMDFNVMTILTALFVGFVVLMPNLFFAFDASIPYESKKDIDPTGQYTGSFAQSFTSDYWVDGFDWIDQQDNDLPPDDRPGWISWWDYGFWCVYLGEHPTAADNFQNGYQFAGSYIASQSEEEAIALQITRLLEGNYVNHGGKFNSSVEQILIRELDDGNMDVHPNYDSFLEYMRHPADHVKDVEDDPDTYGHYIDLKAPNARYATCRVLLTDHLDKEGLVDLCTQVEQDTGTSMRYFGVDSRLFPFEAKNTGIFYAPIKLADKDVKDYLEYWAYAQHNIGTQKDPQWVDYSDNPLSPARVESEAKEKSHNFRIQRYELKYSEDFYKSMFYSCYIGYGGDDIGVPSNNGIPGMKGNLQSYPPMQAWNMTHFRLVYKTLYYSEKDSGNASFPDDYNAMNYDDAIKLYQEKGGDVKSGLGQGAFILKYYPGAVRTGTVCTHNGTPVVGARVTAFDQYGIPHDSMVTGENGTYSVIVPFGDVKIAVTHGALSQPYDFINQFQTDGTSGVPKNLLNLTRFHVSQAQADRTTDYITTENIYVDAGKVHGMLYWDNDNNNKYDEGTDRPVEVSNVSLVHESGMKVYSNAVVSNDSFDYTSLIDTGTDSGLEYANPVSGGQLYFDDLIPGDYNINVVVDSHHLNITDTITMKPRDVQQKDVAIAPASLSGYTLTGGSGENATAESGHTVKLFDPVANRTWINVTDAQGMFSFPDLLPGEYELTLEEEAFEESFSRVDLDLGSTKEVNITLVPVTYGSGNIILTGVPHTRSGSSLENVYIEFQNLENISWSKTAFTDASGDYSIRLVPGDYRVYAKYVSNENILVHIGSVSVTNDSFDYDLTLAPAARVEGTMEKGEGTRVFSAQILFESMSTGESACAVTNSTGHYRIDLPRDDYFVNVYHKTEVGGNIFIYQGSLMKEDMVATQTYDIFVEKGTAVRGSIYWDKNGNGVMDTFVPGMDPGTFYMTPEESMPLTARESVEGITVELISDLGMAKTTTDINGSFEIFGKVETNYTLWAVDDDYQVAVRSLYIPDILEVTNYGLDDVNLSVHPKRTDVVFYGYVDRDHDMVADMPGESASEIEFSVTSRNEYFKDTVLSFNSTSAANITLLPGMYEVKMDDVFELSGHNVTFTFHHELTIPMGIARIEMDVNILELVSSHGDFGYYSPAYPGGPLEFKRPVNATVEFRPMFSYENVQAEYSLFLTENGTLDLNLPSGNYSVSSELVEPVDHSFMLLYSNDANNDLSGTLYKGSVMISGKVSVDGYDSAVSIPIIVRDQLTGAERSTAPYDGAYSLMLEPGHTYQVMINHTSDVSGKMVKYLYTHDLDLENDTVLDIDLVKLVLVKGVVFYDYGHDGGYDENEGLLNSTLVLTSTTEAPDGYGLIRQIINNTAGEFERYLPERGFKVTVDQAGFEHVPLIGGSFNVSTSMPETVKIEVQSINLTVNGYTYLSLDDNDVFDARDEDTVAGVDIHFISRSSYALSDTVISGSDGAFSITLLPGQYYVYAYKTSDPSDELAYLGVTEVLLGEDLSLNLSMSDADRVMGTVTYIDTNGTLHSHLDIDDGIEMHYDDTVLHFNVEDGKYGISEMICLPEGDAQVTVQHEEREFGMKMLYRADTSLNISRGHEESSSYNLHLDKARDYTLSLDFYDQDAFKRTVSPPGPETYRVWLENKGNEPQVVQFSEVHLPDDWNVEYARQNITLAIGERMMTSFKLTTNDHPEADNDNIEIQAASLNSSSKDSIKFNVKTPAQHGFNFYSVDDADNGVDFDSDVTYNVTLENQGNTGDRFEIAMEMEVEGNAHLTDWNATLYVGGDSDRSDVGYQIYPNEPGKGISLLPFETRNYTLSVHTPNSTASYFSDSAKLTITCKPLFTTQVPSKSFSLDLQIRKPNLKLEEVKLKNLDLKNDVSNSTFWVDVGVRSENRECANVPVKVYVDTTLVTGKDAPDGNWTIPMVPEDGVAWLKIPFDAKLNDTDDGQMHTIKVIVDEDDLIDETSENDNKFSESHVIGSTGGSNIPWNWIIFFGALLVATGVGLLVWRRRSELI